MCACFSDCALISILQLLDCLRLEFLDSVVQQAVAGPGLWMSALRDVFNGVDDQLHAQAILSRAVLQPVVPSAQPARLSRNGSAGLSWTEPRFEKLWRLLWMQPLNPTEGPVLRFQAQGPGAVSYDCIHRQIDGTAVEFDQWQARA